MLPEVLKTACKSCSQNDKENLRKFLRRVQLDPKLADAWKKVMEKYDPHRQYQAGLEKFVKEGWNNTFLLKLVELKLYELFKLMLITYVSYASSQTTQIKWKLYTYLRMF